MSSKGGPTLKNFIKLNNLISYLFNKYSYETHYKLLLLKNFEIYLFKGRLLGLAI